MMKSFLDALRPITGNVWPVDEAYVNVRGSIVNHSNKRGNWLWSAIDPTTRLLLATRIAEGSRNSADVNAVLEQASNVGALPDYVVTDSQISYPRGVRSIPHASHVWTNSIRDGFTNISIERYHSEIREKLKSCGGRDTEDSAQVFLDLLRIHHNFVRPHMDLDSRTPTEAAGVSVPGVKDTKYRALIQASSKAGKGVAAKLGMLAEHVHVRNRRDVTVTPKEWLETGTRDEIDAILRGMGSWWVFSGITRGWVRFENAPPVQVEGGRRNARRATV